MELTTVWFILIAVLWIGYFTLEGFDFGVGMLLPWLARDDRERRIMINTIGPVWDGNEVWVLTAGGATFAAFPEWYATLFSGFYLPLLLILLALIVRGRRLRVPRTSAPRPPGARGGTGRSSSAPTSRRCCGAWRSPTSSAACRSTSTKEFTGSLFTLLNPFGLLGGVVTLLLFLTHGAMFLALKTDGDIRYRARAVAVRCGLAAAVAAVVFLVWTQSITGNAGSLVLFAVAALALVGGLVAVRAGREGWAFIGTFVCIALAVGGPVRRRSSPT